MTYGQIASPLICAALLVAARRAFALAQSGDDNARAPFALGAVAFSFAPLCTIELVVGANPNGETSGALLLHALGVALLFSGGLLAPYMQSRYRASAIAAIVIGLAGAFFLTAGYGLIAAAAGYGAAWTGAMPAVVMAAAPLGVLLSIAGIGDGKQQSVVMPVTAGALFGALALTGAAFAGIGALDTPARNALIHDALWIGAAILLVLGVFHVARAKRAELNTPNEGASPPLSQFPGDVIAIILDSENRILDATPAAREMFPAREIDGGKAPFVAFVPADVSIMANTDQPIMAFIDRAGVKRYARMYAAEFGTLNGITQRLAFIELADREVSLCRVKEELQSRIRVSFDENEDICIFVSERGVVSEINRPALSFVKKSRNECVGDYVWNVFALKEGGGQNAWMDLINSAVVDGAAASEAAFRGAEQDRLFRLRVARLGRTGESVQLFISGRDVTDVTRMRISFQEAQARLEQTINERTAELSAAKKTADQASLSKSRFLANMSHELRTPLNAILGYTDLMMQDQQDEGTTDSQTFTDLERVKVNAAHLLTLINDVLDLAKVEANKMELSYSSISIRDLLTEIRASVDPLVAKRANRLVVRCQRNLDTISIDRKKVTQCLLNLLSNAAKFTEAGEITLTITAQGEGASRIIAFEVKDTGLGMSEDQCLSIFEEFAQVENEHQASAGGTGLGLPIARRFAQLMGGDITARSKPGEGSVFTLTVRDGGGAKEAAA